MESRIRPDGFDEGESVMNENQPAFWIGRRVLLTGATGFIGSAVARRLTGLGAIVQGVARSSRASAGECPIHRCDLTQIEGCRALIADVQPEVILHLAGHPYAARDLSRVIPTFNANLATTVNILTCAAEAGGARVVLAGSLEEPCAGEGGAGLSSPYAISKWAASAYAKFFHSQYSLGVVVARLFMVYGPGQRDPKKLIPDVIASLLRRESPQVTSGDRPVDWVYVDDVVSGLLSVAQAPGVEGETLDIGTGELTSVRRVVEILVELIPGAPPAEFGAVPARRDEQVRAARTEAAQATIGWSAQVPLREGLARTVEWYRTGEGAVA